MQDERQHMTVVKGRSSQGRLLSMHRGVMRYYKKGLSRVRAFERAFDGCDFNSLKNL